MHTLAALPPWLEKFWPIALLLVAISIVLYVLPKSDVTHSTAYRRRRVMNWLPPGLTYAFLYMGRYNISVAKTMTDPETGLALMTKADLGLITVIGTTTYAVAFLINGPLTDRFGGRKTILAAALGAAAANFGMGWVLDSGYEPGPETPSGSPGILPASTGGSCAPLRVASVLFATFFGSNGGVVVIFRIRVPFCVGQCPSNWLCARPCLHPARILKRKC